MGEDRASKRRMIAGDANEAATMRIRKSVYSLTGHNDDLSWYAKGVAALRAAPFAASGSWCYQAAVHGFDTSTTAYNSCHFPAPSAVDQAKYWQQCQHQTWFFLPWHRGYLAYFEQIVGAAVVAAGGPHDWALPYWNYSAGPASQHLPPAFLNPTDASGAPNPLYTPGRKLTAGKALPNAYVSLAALKVSVFSGTSVAPGFGGPPTGFNHFGATSGDLENVPHNVVHVGVGGLMSDPDTAALDPIFWLHHANIDRLWEVWHRQGPAFKNPSDPKWLTGVSFPLHDAAGAVVHFDPGGMLDTTKILGGYIYDTIPVPLSPVTGPPIVVTGPLHPGPIPPGPLASASMALTRTSKLIGNSNTPLLLDQAETSAHVDLAQPSARAAIETLGAQPVHAFLNLENVTGARRSVVYEVFIEAPDASGKPHRYPVGLLSSFGVRAASRRDSKHGGSGITTSFDITSIVDTLRAEKHWDDTHVHVVFVQDQTADPLDADETHLSVGRVSVFYR